jgi:hypothetical protein
MLKGIVATGTDNKVRGVARKVLKLGRHVTHKRTIPGKQGGLGALRKDFLNLGEHVRLTRDIAPIVEDGIAKEDDVLGFRHARGCGAHSTSLRALWLNIASQYKRELLLLLALSGKRIGP